MENPAAQRAHQIRKRARRRATADMLLIAATVPSVALLGADGEATLMLGVAALSIGILFFVIRRSRDAVAIARADRWRAEAVAGRGMSLEEWRAGKELAEWDDRRPATESSGDGEGRSEVRHKVRQGVPMEI